MISVEHLTKCYGDVKAVDDLSFTIGEGKVYGFLGPNGAGKSTTMNIMTGCLSATEGTVAIGGYDIFEKPREAKRLLGYLPEHPPLYLNENPAEYLTFVGQAKGLWGAALDRQIQQVMELTKLEPMARRPISALSKGYKQRVGIAQALLGEPRVIILDEPTVGLDPLQIIEIRQLIRGLGKTHTVLFSSHILSEVQAICDEILMLAHGRLVAFDTPENLERQLLSPNRLTLTTDASPEALASLLSGLTCLTSVEEVAGDGPYQRAVLQTDCRDIYEASRALFRAFAVSDYALLELRVEKGSLEDVFLELSDPAEGEDPDGEEGEAS